MSFKNSIPDQVLEYPDVSKFSDVLDSLQQYKQSIIAETLRVNNPALLMNSNWLLKKIGDYGIANLPLKYPLPILQQLLLNVDTLCRTRGSKIGIEFYCSLLSFGEVSINDSEFYSFPKAIVLDSVVQGYITEDNSKSIFYLVSDTTDLNQKVTLEITIKSHYFNEYYPEEASVIKEYIDKNINYQLGFSPDKEVKITYLSRSDFYFHKLLNPYFV